MQGIKKLLVAILLVCVFAVLAACSPTGSISSPSGDSGEPPLSEQPGETEQPNEPEPFPFEPSGSIVVIGDSLLDFWDNGENFLKDFYAEASNKAIKATHIYDWFADDRNFPKILEVDPDEILIGVGINDLKAEATATACYGYYKDLIEKILKQRPNVVIHVVSVNKSEAAKYWVDGIEQLNAKLKTLCDEKDNMYFIDNQDAFLNEDGSYNSSLFIEDKLHFSAAGYAVYEGILTKHFFDYKNQANE